MIIKITLCLMLAALLWQLAQCVAILARAAIKEFR